MFCCLRRCQNGVLRNPTKNENQRIQPLIHLDPLQMGPDVVLLSNYTRITGTGGALCTAPLVQSKSYFEIKIKQAGSWSVGLATAQTDLAQKVGGQDKNSWCLCSDNATRHNKEELRPVVEPSISKPAAASIDAIEMEDAKVLTNFEDFLSIEKHDFPDEGDVVGVAFDHIELNFYFNGKNLDVPFRNVKGTVFPVVYVGDGAILDIILENFSFSPPPSFEKIMLEQSLL